MFVIVREYNDFVRPVGVYSDMDTAIKVLNHIKEEDEKIICSYDTVEQESNGGISAYNNGFYIEDHYCLLLYDVKNNWYEGQPD